MTNPQAIADGLSEAQRRAMKRDRFPGLTCHSRDHRVYAALARKGLLEFRHVIACKGYYLLTPLGLSVRAILAKEEN